MSSFLKLFTINTLLHAPWQENCKNNKFLYRSKNYPVFRGVAQPVICHVIAKKKGLFQRAYPKAELQTPPSVSFGNTYETLSGVANSAQRIFW
jgi:hypothetical protein